MLLGLLAVLGMLLSFYLLAIICEEFFVPSLDELSAKLKLSSDVAGATLMAVGSSAPEFFTSLFAIFLATDASNVGAGTIVGSAIFNILVIIGASALFKTVKLNWQPVIRDMLSYVVTILLLVWSFWDGRISMLEAVLFVAAYIGYVWIVMKWRGWFPYKDEDPIEILETASQKNPVAAFSKSLLSWLIPDNAKYPKLYLATFSLSIVGIAVLSYGLVESALIISEVLHINPTFIALTVLAAGTSIPDLLSSIIVAKQGRGDMAVSNAVGSNVFDILFGLGFPWLCYLALTGKSVVVSNDNLLGSVLLLLATVVSIMFILITRNWKIGKHAGWALIALYVGYIVYVFVTVA